jgi:hypothetical protein
MILHMKCNNAFQQSVYKLQFYLNLKDFSVGCKKYVSSAKITFQIFSTAGLPFYAEWLGSICG